MSLLLRLATLAAAVLTVLGLGIGSASAHAELASSEPSEAQTLTTPPRQITLTFTEAVRAGSAEVVVRGADGRSVTTGPATETDAVVRQPVDLSSNGSYLVAYRVVSQDGHPVTGELTFSYAGAEASDAGPTGVAGSTDSPEPPVTEAAAEEVAVADGGAGAGLWWMLGVSVAVVAGLGVLALRRRGPRG
ncbi:copper resistance protein CopC [Blastococcus sp. MG754426]|uniref:copper resistance CopC family protein n=1 Tax=unclassified Blastococcus TaxID=2619396 RepID=UPI001EEFF220|nr:MULTISPECIES: copper resistance CopC family protein [unclassified Blastococcus]MCF6507796.1 copper resistance protein CopC [Blastococcus sp. MG754426]MCF6510197.1 copper resistance protein CopC [Blastococcus sp. MG754427]